MGLVIGPSDIIVAPPPDEYRGGRRGRVGVNFDPSLKLAHDYNDLCAYDAYFPDCVRCHDALPFQ
jgi:hypothetical protein